MSSPIHDRAPLRVCWELTRACDLACRHCRAEAILCRSPDELTTAECKAVLDDLAGAGRPAPHVIFYREHPLFQLLRTPSRLQGRRGACPYRTLCGGSRARAFAASGDVMGEDPLCPYQPADPAA